MKINGREIGEGKGEYDSEGRKNERKKNKKKKYQSSFKKGSQLS